ncbi:MAG: nucleoside deaminase [Candidatus Promineifilaceae bacterium]
MKGEYSEHEKWLRQAFVLARQAREAGNHPFGALLVRQGVVVATAVNSVNTGQDVTRHAELNLISQAWQQLGPDVLAECTLYTSTEPCPMCSGAIFWAGVPRVVFGCSVEGLAEMTGGGSLAVPCRDIFSRGARQTAVIGPLLEEEGKAVHEGFWR